MYIYKIKFSKKILYSATSACSRNWLLMYYTPIHPMLSERVFYYLTTNKYEYVHCSHFHYAVFISCKLSLA